MEAVTKGFLPLGEKRESKTRLLLLLALLVSPMLQARENSNQGGKMPQKQQQDLSTLAGSCAPATAQTDLNINNVRTTILAGGDMWWDLIGPKYEIPKGGGKHSLFSGALWIGGIDGGGNLKVAAMTYRQTGNDFWPGPLDQNASISNGMCLDYDKHFRITRAEVDAFLATGTMTPGIANWPGNGPYGQPMAPYYDADGSGDYNPNTSPGSDYPAYDVTGSGAGTLYGDQTIWWVFNDGGNIHTETQSEPIGLEIQAQAFAFNTNDEINNMTFYQYKIINRSTNILNQTYFGQWVDADLGNYLDDYVGCDVERGLGYCYNGDQDDEGLAGYGLNPPAIGVDFFQGPLADSPDWVDNDRDCIIDEPGEQIIMSRFVYYNNDGTVTGNPDSRTDFYNYLKGLWKDGTPMTYGGNGYGGSMPCNFMFPGDSDHNKEWGTGGICANPAGLKPDWFESVTPGDRRFLQSAGPFTLQPGAVNYITTGVVWAQATQGGPMASVELIKTADDKAQALFDSNFKLLAGPDAPKITIQELDKELLLYITNEQGSNNFNENYVEEDPLIIGAGVDDTFRFEGYQIFQLKDATVSVSEIHNPDKARLVAQCDKENFRPNGTPIGQLVNFEFSQQLNANVPTEEVNGANTGIVHSFRVTEDLFAAGDKRLVNHKQYYYLALAYAYNEFKMYDQGNPNLLDGQKKPYKAGRNKITVYTGIPHIPSPEAWGTVQSSGYGSGPKLKRMEGQGNGGLVLDLTEETVSEILASADHRSYTPVYEAGRGPVNIKVIDPLNVPEGEFKLVLDAPVAAGKWKLINLTTGEIVNSDKTIAIANEQIIPQWGISVTMVQSQKPGTNTTNNNGFLEATMQFSDATKPWLTGAADQDGPTPLNWIRSGKIAYPGAAAQYNDYTYSIDADGNLQGSGLDDNEVYEKVLGGTWAPYRLASFNAYGPAWNTLQQMSNMNKLASVDLVITSDQSKWTRCAVLEMNEEAALAEGGAKKLNLRMSPSVGKNGSPDGSGTKGLGWFPGYAINVETGERLNIMFGENSFNAGENGRNMKWDPTSTLFTDPVNLVMGGQHYIYIMGHNAATGVPAYDEAAYIHGKLSESNYNPSVGSKMAVFADAMWTGIPLVAPGRSLLESDVKIRLRVTRPYEKLWALDGAPTPENNNNPVYTFNTSDLRVETNNAEAAKDALELINIVPNPYYAYSAYEKNQLDNRVKVTNLPPKCTITIYTLNGTLVRKYKKDEPSTSLDWDLKNQAGIPVASGLYIVHVDVEGVGEKILKWFGVMRPQDLDTF